MEKPRTDNPRRKRVTRAQFDERLSIPLGPRKPDVNPAHPSVGTDKRKRAQDS